MQASPAYRILQSNERHRLPHSGPPAPSSLPFPVHRDDAGLAELGPEREADLAGPEAEDDLCLVGRVDEAKVDVLVGVGIDGRPDLQAGRIAQALDVDRSGAGQLVLLRV